MNRRKYTGRNERSLEIKVTQVSGCDAFYFQNIESLKYNVWAQLKKKQQHRINENIFKVLPENTCEREEQNKWSGFTKTSHKDQNPELVQTPLPQYMHPAYGCDYNVFLGTCHFCMDFVGLSKQFACAKLKAFVFSRIVHYMHNDN